MALSRNWIVVCGVALSVSVVGCEGGKKDFKSATQVQKDRAEIIEKKEKEHAHDKEHGHHHHAPHHGSLTMLGEHAAQIELTVDAEAGKLTIYVHDGEAEKPLTLDQPDLSVTATPEGSKEALTLKLVPSDAAKQDDGFAVQDDKLKGVTKLTGTIASLKIKGKDKADEKVAVTFDAKEAAEEAEEAHKEGHDDHKGEGKSAAHKDHDEKGHDDKDHKDHKDEKAAK